MNLGQWLSCDLRLSGAWVIAESSLKGGRPLLSSCKSRHLEIGCASEEDIPLELRPSSEHLVHLTQTPHLRQNKASWNETSVPLANICPHPAHTCHLCMWIARRISLEFSQNCVNSRESAFSCDTPGYPVQYGMQVGTGRMRGGHPRSSPGHF